MKVPMFVMPGKVAVRTMLLLAFRLFCGAANYCTFTYIFLHFWVILHRLFNLLFLLYAIAVRRYS
jgi:hypothetical protein